MLRFLLWRLLGLVALLCGAAAVSWLLSGGPGELLRPRRHGAFLDAGAGLAALVRRCVETARTGAELVALALVLLAPLAVAALLVRARARSRRRYARFEVELYRTDRASSEAVTAMFAALHKRLLVRWWDRMLAGQPSMAVEIHRGDGEATATGRGSAAAARVWFAVACPADSGEVIAAALRGAYPNCRLRPVSRELPSAALTRLKKRGRFIERSRRLDPLTFERSPPVDRLLQVMGACAGPAFVQLAITPAPAVFERVARDAFRHHEGELSQRRRRRVPPRDRSYIEDAELRAGLELQHRPLFFTDIRVGAAHAGPCGQIAGELRADSAENRLVERPARLRQGRLGLYARRVGRGEGNPLPGPRALFATTELAALWHLPSTGFVAVPVARSSAPWAPAAPEVFRPSEGNGMLRDALGPVSIHPQMRRQNTAAPGTVEQGKTSFLVATVAEDLRRERCAVIVVDPKGDAADAAISCVPSGRTCTVLDFAHPTCGFNPLAVAAPADVIADYVVGALKNLFTDADIRASSDRYLRNAVIAVLAYDRNATLWDAARLLSVGEEGYAYRRAVGARVRTMPEFREISAFFTAELSAQLADARSTTTAKLDAPVNKLARLLNSSSIKRVLLNESLRVDLDAVIAGAEVLVVRGALGAMGAGNTSVLMQLLMGMLDAALARQQDRTPADQRVAVALKVDEAPLVINRGFAQTIALKRSAGLETVACWQTDAQWAERELREQLDALFAHRVYFATASARDARAAAAVTMAEFSDTVRPGIGHLSTLGSPDVRLHLPRHHAVVSVTTPAGRQPAFIAQTVPLRRDPDRLALHAARQAERGGRHLDDLRQAHWEPPAREAPRGGDATAVRGEAASRPAGASAPPRATGDVAREAAESYAELVSIDRAQSVRVAKLPSIPREHASDERDLELLELIAQFGHVLSTQIHRRFNRTRSISTTQRRLKRLADAGLVTRLQFHSRDGGGAPMAYRTTGAARELLDARGSAAGFGPSDAARAEAARALARVRREIHVAGWALALEELAGRRCRLRGPEESVLSPSRAAGEAGAGPGPADLRLPGGRVAHDFLRTAPDGRRGELDRFDTLRPDATVETGPLDVLVVLDDRPLAGAAAARLERYDHFLSGWSTRTQRYGLRSEAAACVVFVCRDRRRARALAREADHVLCACRAYPGEHPEEWQYPGRELVRFAAEADVHRGSRAAFGVPDHPPLVRASIADAGPTAAEATAVAHELPGAQVRAGGPTLA